jgi:L-asparagine permease
MPGAPFTSWLTLLFLLSVLVLMAFDYPNGTYTIGSIPLIAVLVAGWFGVRKRVHAIHNGAGAQPAKITYRGLSVTGQTAAQLSYLPPAATHRCC